MVSAPKPATAYPSSPRFGKNRGALALLVLSVSVHLTLSFSIFQITFSSPVVKVDRRYSAGKGEAKRLVLIVADGLRADKCFRDYDDPPFLDYAALPHPMENLSHAISSEGRTTPAPFLRNLVQSGVAKYGVSHAGVPTESRPGHVALLAGMPEDLSAVTTGWQSNPVAVDSVINQSTHAFSFGSPDITHLFPGPQVDIWSYSHEMEDFSTDATHLDIYVLDRLNELFQNASTSAPLRQTLAKDGNVFFLHLLSLDSTGHSYRPHGMEYHRAVRVADYVVEKSVESIEKYFRDEGTAFVFTADHGMSSIGNHGGGEEDNTRTPLIVWGAGVSQEVDLEGGLDGHDEYSRGWGLKGVRRDVQQLDIAPLMSVLSGIPIPANSAGRLPIDYLAGSPEFKAQAAIANYKNVIEQYLVKSDFKRANSIGFRPFKELVESETAGTKSLESHAAAIDQLMVEEKYEEAMTRAMELVEIGLRGSSYFRKYDWFLLQFLVVSGYVGFMGFAMDYILKAHVFPGPPPPESKTRPLTTLLVQGILFSLFALVEIRFLIEQAPSTHHLYAIFPYCFWTSILRDPWSFRLVYSAARKSLLPSLGKIFLTLLTLQLIVVAYTNRLVLTGMLIVLGISPWLTTDLIFRKNNRQLLQLWTASTLATSVFPALPVEKGESLSLIMAGGGLFIVLGLVSLHLLRDPVPPPTKKISEVVPPSPTAARARNLLRIEMILILASMVVTFSSSRSLRMKLGLPFINRLSGWIILVSSSLIPILHGRAASQPFFERLSVLLFAFGPSFIILSISYEALFYGCFTTMLCIWLLLETKLAESRVQRAKAASTNGKGKAGGEGKGGVRGTVGVEHVRIAVVFLLLLHTAFFGCGNVASISSFYLEPVFRLIPIFSPFPMASLLLYKLLIPFFALTSTTTLLATRLALPPFALIIVASILADVLTINFFLGVRDDLGSWLEIGSRISHFAICSFLGIFNSALFLLGEFLMARVS